MGDFIPKWHRELEIFDKIKPIIILEGNVLDKYQYPTDGSVQKGSILRLVEYLHYYFKDAGYQNIAFYDSIRGFYNNCEDGYIQNFAKLVGGSLEDQHIRADFKGRNGTASNIVKQAISQANEATAVVMDFASRYIASPSNMEQSEIDSFTILLQASIEGKDVRTQNGILKNVVILLVNKINDLPAWFYLDNPNVKTILLKTPSKEEREALVKGANFPSFFASDIFVEENAYYQEHPDELEKIQDKFVALTEGFTFTELNGLRRLSKNQQIHIKNMCDVVDLYKFGIKENPWNTLKYQEMQNAHADFEKRVKGQEIALTKTLDVIKRAMTGMSGMQSSGKPKGVLFFAGPTGTGKTETAKTLAEKLFGDEHNCIRFDMSEYGQSHSDQKLLGAPPGYVGYEAGGQLTNAVKNNPFSILLFDEIEKAHPSILDKFLQILEDGRMTDGQGNTVYFSETIIIFTSNLGIYSTNNMGERVQRVNPDMPYEEVQKNVRKGIEDYFKLQLGRPEILNRIGENIVVFDFIRPDVAKSILAAQIDKIVKNVQSEKNIKISISDSAMKTLEDAALGNLENGGRGIGNIVESLFINPLSRYMFDNEIFGDKEIVIEQINAEKNAILTCLLGEIGDFMIVTALVKTGIGKEICDDSVFNGENIISQDAVIVFEKIESSWFAVADGVGGNAGGHEASTYLLDYIQCNYEKTDDEAALELLLKDANISLIDNAQKIAGKEQMATTFTGVFFCNEGLKIAHSGNTRLYALQGNYLKQLTSDHTTYQWLIRQGNYEAAEMCNKSEIISCFGGGDNDLLKMLSVETILMESIPNTLIMTSDGIHDYVDIDTFEEILCEPIPIKERVVKLWKKAQELGSSDDCSVLIMER